MADPRFFRRAKPISLADLAEIANATIAGNVAPNQTYVDVKPLSDSGPKDVSFLDNKRYVGSFSVSKAGACVVEAAYVEQAPSGMALLVTDSPYLGYALIAAAFYPTRADDNTDVSANAHIESTASIRYGAMIEAGAVIQAHAEIGAGAHIGVGAVVGPGVVIGTGSRIGPNTCLSHCLIGDRVIIHGGVNIGQDGFGFAQSSLGHHKVPQLGRVIIEDDVEIGANTTIDRGAGPDTIVGAGTKIDNLVQIAHNVRIGKGCIIVSQVGISGSTEIGDFVMIGGQAGLTGHLQIGSGSKIAAQSGVMRDVDPGTTVGGSPAKPMREWLREVAIIERLGKKKGR
ncbi:MAG: UDP-3-O-(3-hydroxymyristoyl)glucosamine N-acyltransferase [Magnetovibrio sp.]|nr:UDP-3-O-(3-hydroxymyristoyl)glucosamine N-acyltransferase [Magnetovibrio sp.]